MGFCSAEKICALHLRCGLNLAACEVKWNLKPSLLTRGKLSQNQPGRGTVRSFNSNAVKQRLNYTEQFPSAKAVQPGSFMLHCSGTAAFGGISGKCYSPSDTGVSQRETWLMLWNGGLPSCNRPPPSSVSRDSYLVEVGGPILSLRGLSFISELFVCSVLHCHTALANLPNESQELHDSWGEKKNWQQDNIDKC